MDEVGSDEVGQAIACSKLKFPVRTGNFTEFVIEAIVCYTVGIKFSDEIQPPQNQ